MRVFAQRVLPEADPRPAASLGGGSRGPGSAVVSIPTQLLKCPRPCSYFKVRKIGSTCASIPVPWATQSVEGLFTERRNLQRYASTRIDLVREKRREEEWEVPTASEAAIRSCVHCEGSVRDTIGFR